MPLAPLGARERPSPQFRSLLRRNPLQVTSALTRYLSHLTDAPTSPGDFDKVLGVPVAPSACLFLASVGLTLSRGPAGYLLTPLSASKAPSDTQFLHPQSDVHSLSAKPGAQQFSQFSFSEKLDYENAPLTPSPRTHLTQGSLLAWWMLHKLSTKFCDSHSFCPQSDLCWCRQALCSHLTPLRAQLVISKPASLPAVVSAAPAPAVLSG